VTASVPKPLEEDVTYKSVLVHVEPNPLSDARLAAAAGLARRFHGRLIGVGAQAFLPSVDFGYGYLDGEAIQALRDQLKENLNSAQARFDAAAKGLSTVWRSFVDLPGRVMASEARGADLVLASRTPPHCDQTAFAQPGDLIMAAGLPVIVLPPDTAEITGKRVLIGWKNTLQARSAITAALPLLVEAEEVVLSRMKVREDEGAEAELQDVAERLKLHGVQVRLDARTRAGRSVAHDLLSLAAEQELDLIVVGAYAHARMTEWVFGGVTDDLLREADRPVLFAR
jgi:nucleotide-binding universal stress UspA family protein